MELRYFASKEDIRSAKKRKGNVVIRFMMKVVSVAFEGRMGLNPEKGDSMVETVSILGESGLVEGLTSFRSSTMIEGISGPSVGCGDWLLVLLVLRIVVDLTLN